VIDWDKLRGRGEAGLLTADETDALVEVAQTTPWIEDGGSCPLCGASPVYNWRGGNVAARHFGNCPITILEAATQ